MAVATPQMMTEKRAKLLVRQHWESEDPSNHAAELLIADFKQLADAVFRNRNNNKVMHNFGQKFHNLVRADGGNLMTVGALCDIIRTECYSKQCDVCGLNGMTASGLRVHTTWECPLRATECGICASSNVPAVWKDLHNERCAQEPYMCVACNARGLVRGKAAEHAKVCNRRVEICPYGGCDNIVPFPEAENHSKVYLEVHFEAERAAGVRLTAQMSLMAAHAQAVDGRRGALDLIFKHLRSLDSKTVPTEGYPISATLKVALEMIQTTQAAVYAQDCAEWKYALSLDPEDEPVPVSALDQARNPPAVPTLKDLRAMKRKRPCEDSVLPQPPDHAWYRERLMFGLNSGHGNEDTVSKEVDELERRADVLKQGMGRTRLLVINHAKNCHDLDRVRRHLPPKIFFGVDEPFFDEHGPVDGVVHHDAVDDGQ